MRETETAFREWMHLFRKWMRLFRECMRLFRGSKSAHQLSVHVRWESKDTPLGTNNQSQQPYHQLFDLKKTSPTQSKRTLDTGRTGSGLFVTS